MDKKVMQQIEEECKKIINLCESFQENWYSSINDRPIMHYNVRILKCQPSKVLINGKIKDKIFLSANERRAVKTQEEINRARAILRLQNKVKQKNLGAQIT